MTVDWSVSRSKGNHSDTCVFDTQAAAGWPLSELLDRRIADFFGLDTILDAYDRAPSECRI